MGCTSHLMTHWNINILQVNDNTFLLYTCRYATLWIAPIVLVGYSFGGLVLKSLVVDVCKGIYQKVTNEYEIRTRKNCERFLENLKGKIFYGVPHTSGAKLLEYFTWQSQEMNSINKKLMKAQSSLLNNIESFNRQMEQLTVDFGHAIKANINIYAFVTSAACCLFPFASLHLALVRWFLSLFLTCTLTLLPIALSLFLALVCF